MCWTCIVLTDGVLPPTVSTCCPPLGSGTDPAQGSNIWAGHHRGTRRLTLIPLQSLAGRGGSAVRAVGHADDQGRAGHLLAAALGR